MIIVVMAVASRKRSAAENVGRVQSQISAIAGIPFMW